MVVGGTDRPRTFAVEGLDHVVLRCRALEATKDFYVGVLGLVEERCVEGIGLVQLRAGRSLVDLVPAGEAPVAPNVDHICLAVSAPDMESVCGWLVSRGVELIGEPTIRYGAGGYAPAIYLRDPEGNVVELSLAEGARA